MREQEIFFDQGSEDKRIVVLKTYDGAFAREAFNEMDLGALEKLAICLDLNASFDAVDIPSSTDPNYPEFLWEALEEGAREDWNSFSYFIVREIEGGQTANHFVSSDWPSAEAYARNMLSVPA